MDRLTLNDIGELEKTLEYRFNDVLLLERALTHRSYRRSNNERLEFLGDSVLGCVIAEALFQQFPKAPEGDLTKMRARLVRGSTLATVSRNLGVADYLYLGEGEKKSGGHNRDSILSDAFEAIIGAVYLDGGFEVVKTTILVQFTDLLKIISPKNLKDSKTRLQELLQKLESPLPNYTVVAQTGQQHNLTFQVQCDIEHALSPFVATGSSRRLAEQSAAEMALKAVQA